MPNADNFMQFDDVTIINDFYGARFKSWQGDSGKQIFIDQVFISSRTQHRPRQERDLEQYPRLQHDLPIFVTQSYFNQANGAAVRPNNASVIMQDFTWANFTGTINQSQPSDGSCASNPCWYNLGLPNLAHTEAVIVECNTDSSCQNFALRNIEFSPPVTTPPTAICVNCTAANNPRLGFSGVSGYSVPTA